MARDLFHHIVRLALEKEGWQVTHDPFSLSNKSEKMNYEIDLGAEKLIAAEKGTQKIAVEIKSCLQISFAHEFHSILGQYLVYYEGLKEIEPDRVLFLAIPKFADEKLQEHIFLLRLIATYKVNIIVFDEIDAEIIVWKN